jgi:hypothetical protein
MKSHQQQSYRTHRDLQLLFWSFIHPRDVKFVNNVTITLSDEQMIKIKVVDLGVLQLLLSWLFQLK